MAITVGDKAPAFILPTETGEVLALHDIKENYVVLYFYPKDDTPGCTLESIEFTGAVKNFAKANARIIGISGGTIKSKQKFCQKHSLGVTLLADEKFEVSQKYEVYGEKKFMGKTYLGINRRTFIIGPDRKIAFIYETVKPEGHAKEVLIKVTELQS